MQLPSLQPPTHTEVVERLRAIVRGKRTREEVSKWADQWVMAEQPALNDDSLLELLILASGVSLLDPISYPQQRYLYSAEEISTWLMDIVGIGPDDMRKS